ncbi:NADH-quinone oxidoreductase subunit J [Gemmatimonadales bacterium]|nr:NADH-quinone oxidoreductase subunit J [Gemmatimonadales bacterium]
MAPFLFYLFAGLAIGGAIGVVMAKSPIGSLLFMVVTLGAMAGIFVLLEAHFLAAIQIIVYAGAIMVLFLFVIMLLNLGHDYKKDLKGGAFAVMSFAVTGGIAGLMAQQIGVTGIEDGVGGASIDALIAEHGAVGAIATELYTTYVVPFEITGILLLVAIVGALVLAKKEV